MYSFSLKNPCLTEGRQQRFISQEPDTYFWWFDCNNGTVLSYETCVEKSYFELQVRDTRPDGDGGEINLNGLPWHLIVQDFEDFTGLDFNDPRMRYIWLETGIFIGSLPFIPKYLKWTFPSLKLDIFIVSNRGFSQNFNTKWKTVLTLIRRLVTSRLIRICTVCKYICTGLQGWKV